MKDFHVYSPVEAITANLRECAERRDAVAEQTLAHLCELADELSATDDLPTLLSSLPDHRPATLTERPSEERILPPDRFSAPVMSVMLCRELSRRVFDEKPFPTACFFLDPEDDTADVENAANRVIYHKSSYTDEAFLCFSKALGQAHAAYAHGFPACCEAVYNGEADFCILPVESSAEGPLNAFTRLIMRYDLKIAASCDVYSGAAARSTRFALLRKRILPLFAPADNDCYFECALPQADPAEITGILFAAELCGLRLYRTITLPSLETQTQLESHFVFRTNGADLHSFLFYLAMETPHYTPIGYYPHLTQKGIH